MLGYAFFIPSKSSLAARRSSIICTGILVPFIQGFPLHIFGSITILSIALFISQTSFLFVFYVNSHTGLTIEMFQFDSTSGDKDVCIATPNTLFFLSSLREMADIFLVHEA